MRLTNQRSRFLGGGRLAVPVPVLGTELLVNGDMETWASATDAGTWSESIAGTSTIARNNTDQHGGTYCAQMTVDGSNSNVYMIQGAAVTGTWYLVSVWAKTISGSPILIFGKVGQGRSVSLTGAYAQFYTVFCVTTTQAFLFGRAAASNSFVIDDASAMAITLASMFSTRPYGTHVTVKAQATIVAGTRAGVVCNLDSATSPANFVIASHDGANCRLTKCVAGTYTELISTAVTYVAGAAVEVRRPAGGDIWQLFYNGSQVGTNQTISDAAIKAATLAGLFNSYSGNSLAAFSCVPSA